MKISAKATSGLLLLAGLGIGSTGALAAVTYQARGTAVSGTGAVTPTWPTHAVNDIALLVVESCGGEAVTLSNPAGFVEVAGSPQATGTGASGTRLTVFWARATSTIMAAPTVADPGDHVYARIFTYRGAVTSGNPWNVTGGGIKPAESRDVTVSGVTTTVANTLIVQAATRDNDSTAAPFKEETNVNLTGITERNDAGTTAGNGGGFAVWDGGMAAAGATGDTAVIVNNSVNAFLTIALVPQTALTATRFYMQNAAPDFATVTTNRGAWDSTASVLQRKLSRIKFGPIASLGVAESSATDSYDALVLKLVSEPITVAQTISGTLNFVAGSHQSNDGMNANWHVHAYVTVGDTDMLRGTLVDDYTEPSGINTWPTTAAGVGPVSPLVLNPVAISANDRIVIEAGYVASNTRTSSFTGTLWYGGTDATDLAPNGDETSLPGWWEFDSDLFAGAPKPHHIEINHDGNGKTCAPEQLTVKACADAACSSLFTSTGVSGVVTWTGSPGGTIPFSIPAGTGQATVSLPVATAQTVTLVASSVFPPPDYSSTCINTGGGAACSIIFVKENACFDAVEVGAAAATPIYTKLAGTPFSLDVLAGAQNYKGTVQVALVDPAAASGNCTDTNAGLTNATVYPYTFTGGGTGKDNGRHTFSFNYANAAKNVKVRIFDTSTTTPGCSSDAFAIRPAGLTITSPDATADATGTSPGATPRIKAGAAFTLDASAVAGYNGTPSIDNSLVSAHGGAVTHGTVSGAFSAANPASGLASSSFSYSEVGYFKLDTDGVYDNTFTAVDSVAGDCVAGSFSNMLNGSGKYGCNFGNTAASDFFGRFIPDHFGVVPAVFDNRSDVCSGGLLLADGVTSCVPAFTYMGEPMKANFTLSAENSGNTRTQNYTGAFAKLDPLASDGVLAFAAANGAGILASPTNLTARLDTSLIGASGSGSFSHGIAVISVPIGIAACTAFTCPANTNPDREDGPYAAVDAGIAPVDSDLVTTLFDLDTDDDGIPDHTTVNSDSTEVRYGRIRLSNAYGSELLPLSITASVQYFDGTAVDCCYTASTADNETQFNTNLVAAGGNVQATIIKGPLAAGNLSIVAPGPAKVENAAAAFKLGAPNVAGSADIMLTAPAYLLHAAGRVTFGVYKGARQFIYLREAY